MRKIYRVSKRTNKKRVSKRTFKRTNKKKVSKRTKRNTKKGGMPGVYRPLRISSRNSNYSTNDNNMEVSNNNSNNNSNNRNNRNYSSNSTVAMDADDVDFNRSIIADYDTIPIDPNEVTIEEADPKYRLIYDKGNEKLVIELVFDHDNYEVDIIINYTNPNFNVERDNNSYLIRKYAYYLIEYSIRKNGSRMFYAIKKYEFSTKIHDNIHNIMETFMSPQNRFKRLNVLKNSIKDNIGANMENYGFSTNVGNNTSLGR